MGKLIGKLSTYFERQEHGENYPTNQIQEEVIPDLMVYALQLSNLLGIDLEDKYFGRLEENILHLTKKE